MTYTYDPTGDIGRCRLLVRDTTEAAALFQDEDYQAFLALEGDVRLAAAAALETIASDQALKLKVLKAGTVSLDGASVSNAILKRAELLRQQAGLIDPTTGQPNYAGFDIAEQVVDAHSFRERVVDEALRGR
jgi:hypothetical protein